jgi:uncharacterized protein
MFSIGRQIAINAATIAIVFLLFFLFTKLAGPIPFFVSNVNTNKSDTFTVTGEGTIDAKPDLALVTVGITAQGTTVQAAQDQINSVIGKVSTGIKKLGVSDGDIQTQNYSINPNMDFQSSTQKITGYSANTNLVIKIHKLETVNQIIDTATENGANQVGNVAFDVKDKQKLMDQAREKAVADAKNKAQQASRTAGFQLGRIITYTEGGSPNDYPRPMAMGTADAVKNVPTQVEPGSTEIKLVVTLGYEIH